MLIYVSSSYICWPSTFLRHFDLVKVMFKQNVSLTFHIFDQTHKSSWWCLLSRPENIIFSHFQNICSTFTHFQSDLAFPFPKFQYLRYSWDQRPEPGNCLLREEKYPLIPIKKNPNHFCTIVHKNKRRTTII